jgi:predicted RNase H-like nuclease (RuvC/YqgF family)
MNVVGTVHASPGRRRTLRIVSNYEQQPEVPCQERLAASQREIQKLREENSELMKASNAFGQLAERLNTELRQVRRLGDADRRRWSRPGAMPRRSSAEARPSIDP